MQKISFLLFTVISFFFLCQTTDSQQVYQHDQILPPDPKITIGKLENGLTYYIRENKKPEKRAELRLVVKAGSVLEDNDQQGLAHFLEHMAFNGTKSFPKHEIINYLEKCGIRFGPDLNAYTSFDETVYMLQVPTDSIEIMKKGFKILKEWAQDISFETDEIEKERGVVIEEWRLQRGANYRVAMKHIPFELYKSKYADRITIGKKEVLDSFSRETLVRFYKDWYRPNLIAVLAVGDFDKKEIENIIKEYFGRLANPPNQRERIQYDVPDHSETLVSIVTDPELTRSSVEISFKRNDKEAKTAGEYRNHILQNLYISMLNARFSEMLQQANPPFLYAYASDGRMVANKYIFSVGARVKENAILSGFEAALSEIFRVRQYGFTATELERVKEQSLRAMEKYFLERDKTESNQFVNEYIRNFLINETIPGIDVELALYKQFLPEIALEEINKLTEQKITNDNRVVTISLPEKENVKIPIESEIISLIEKISIKPLEPYVDKIKSEPLIPFLQPSGKVLAEKKIKSIGVIEWKLTNGVRVVLKPTDFKNDEILFSAFSNGGTSLVNDSDYVSAAFASQIISNSGIGSFNLTELQKRLSGKIVRVNPYISQLSEGFSGSVSPQDIETLFQLIYLYGTSTRKDTIAFSSLITRYKESLMNRNVSPEAAYSDTIQVTLANYHFRSRPVSIPMMDEINLDKSIKIYKERFADFNDFTFVFVGAISIDTIKQFVEQYIALLPSIKRIESWKDVGIKPPKGIISKKVVRGIEPKSMVNITFTGSFEWSQQSRYNFNSTIEALNIKFREVLREDKGGTYGVRLSGSPSKFPRSEYNITLSWGCNPERIGELVNEAFMQIDSLKKKPLDPIYIEKVSETQRRTYEVNLKRNSFWLNNLNAYYSNNEDPEMILNYPKLVDGLTAKTIQESVIKYFDMQNYVKVILMPEKK